MSPAITTRYCERAAASATARTCRSRWARFFRSACTPHPSRSVRRTPQPAGRALKVPRSDWGWMLNPPTGPTGASTSNPTTRAHPAADGVAGRERGGPRPPHGPAAKGGIAEGVVGGLGGGLEEDQVGVGLEHLAPDRLRPEATGPDVVGEKAQRRTGVAVRERDAKPHQRPDDEQRAECLGPEEPPLAREEQHKGDGNDRHQEERAGHIEEEHHRPGPLADEEEERQHPEHDRKPAPRRGAGEASDTASASGGWFGQGPPLSRPRIPWRKGQVRPAPARWCTVPGSFCEETDCRSPL